MRKNKNTKEIIFIKEEEYQKIKARFKKNDDLFSKYEMIQIKKSLNINKL